MDEPNVPWQQLYRRALLELDPGRLMKCIELAEGAIRARQDRLGSAPAGDIHAAERQALDDALYALSSLRRTFA